MRLVLLALVLLTSVAHADRIAVIDTSRFYEKGGIARWLAARAKLDEDRKVKAVEIPDGEKPAAIPCDEPLMGAERCREYRKREAVRRSEAERDRRGRVILDDIEAEVTAAVQSYAKAQRIDLLLPREETMIYVSPTADITAAFIKDFNAKPAPKPKR